MKVFISAFSAFLFAPFLFAFAAVSITEIMYDPAGTEENGNRDWIELYNESNDTIFIKGGSANDSWRIYEKNDSTGTENNRTISPSPYQGESLSLAAGEYAIAAKDGARFKQEYPSYAGKIFVASAITLTDTGRTIGLRIGPAGEIWGLVSYSKEQGAHDDGNSLQKSGGNFIAAVPTPGTSTMTESSGTSTSTPTTSNVGGSGPVVLEPQVFVNAGPDKVTVVGADVIFEGKAYGLEQKPLENARYIWNFGDGTAKEGKQVSHAYRYPGEYIVILDVASGYFAGSDRLKVTVENSKMLISSLGDGTRRFVELRNDSSHELDISGWILKEGNVIFTIPERTYISGNKKLVFPSEVTLIPVGSDVSLLYPSGALADRYVPGRTATVPKKESNPAPSLPVVEKAAISLAANAAATVGTDMTDEKWPSIYKWLLGVLALALVAIAGVFLLPRSKGKSEDKLSADDFKIIEEK